MREQIFHQEVLWGLGIQARLSPGLTSLGIQSTRFSMPHIPHAAPKSRASLLAFLFPVLHPGLPEKSCFRPLESPASSPLAQVQHLPPLAKCREFHQSVPTGAGGEGGPGEQAGTPSLHLTLPSLGSLDCLRGEYPEHQPFVWGLGGPRGSCCLGGHLCCHSLEGTRNAPRRRVPALRVSFLLNILWSYL